VTNSQPAKGVGLHADRRFRAACDGPLGRDQAPQNCLICTVSDTEASVSVEHLSTTLAAICGYLGALCGLILTSGLDHEVASARYKR
jgi:hypothetical protein